ncbi:MAG TPA: DUF6481 family protein [Allosphingosinicella sp.]|nr:DUF6481 family protein [Allosphingosinicella sp.]
MPSYKDPSFQDRSSQAAEAKQRALDKLRQKPPVDEAVLAERRAARERKEAAEAEKREAKRAAEQAVKDAKAAEIAAAEEAKRAAAEAAEAERIKNRPKLQTEAERKAARDARYAARKARQ